jgi:CBS domain-containing protein
MFPVKDIMTKNVITVTRETPIMDAVKMLVDHRITGIPVVNEEKNLVGILSEFDVLRLLTETTVDHSRIVDEFMTKKVISFEDTATAIEVCEFFLANSSKRRMPITHQGKLVGLVSRADIVKLIVKFRHKET